MTKSTTTLSAAQRTAVRHLLRIAPVADELAAKFSADGHEFALVGGSVRDALLDRLGSDLDFTTSARPDDTKRLLTGWVDDLWEVGKAYGTIGARKDGFHIEITTYRSDVYDRSSRKPAVAFGDSIFDDLVRRDFTINAMAVRLPSREFVDPHNGLQHLVQRLITTPGTPEDSFADDPLRMLRAARFAAQLEFEIDPAVQAAMRDMADRISIVSEERIRDELSKLLLSPRPRTGLTLLVETGLADRIIPELPALRLEIDEHHRHKDVYEHSLTVLEQAVDLESRLPDGGPDLVTRLAALLHDIGKPTTRRFEPGGGVSFYHHDVVGGKLTRKRLTKLRYPSSVVDDVARLVELHLRFHGYAGGEWTDSAVRRYVRDAGHLLDRLHVLTRADCTTRNRRKAQALREAYDALEERITRLAEQEELAAMRPDLDGNQIMDILGVRPGPVVGRAWRFLLELRLDRGPVGAEIAREELLKWWAGQQRAATDSEGPATSGDQGSGRGVVAVHIEELDGVFVEGFEVGLRFETPGGEVIGSILWSDFVESVADASVEAYYDSVLEQDVPAGTVVVLASANVGLGPPPEIPDVDGPLRCRLEVDVPQDGRVEVEITFDDPDACLRLR